MRHRLPVVAILSFLGPGSTTIADEKLTAEHVVARHLGSLGWPDTQAAQALRIAQGSCHFDIRRGGAGTLDGKTRISSEGRRFHLELPFASSEYFGESFSFDGSKVEVGFIQPRRRSPIGEFLATYDALLKEGLVSGVLSTAWPLLELAGRGPKVEYEGLKKVDKRPLHQLAYKAAQGQGDVRVLLFFEPETFRHVRTKYSLWLRPSMSAAIDRSASQQDTRFEMVESFGDFETAAGLTFPKRWTLTFHMDGPSTNALWHWESVIEKVSTAGTSP